MPDISPALIFRDTFETSPGPVIGRTAIESGHGFIRWSTNESPPDFTFKPGCSTHLSVADGRLEASTAEAALASAEPKEDGRWGGLYMRLATTGGWSASAWRTMRILFHDSPTGVITFATSERVGVDIDAYNATTGEVQFLAKGVGSNYTSSSAIAAELGVQPRLIELEVVGNDVTLHFGGALVGTWTQSTFPLIRGFDLVFWRVGIESFEAWDSKTAYEQSLGGGVIEAMAAAPSMLGVAQVRARHDFSAGLGDVSTRYLMDLITPSGSVRVPISSWQATLQQGRANYVQCVVPAVASWVEAISTASEFVINRAADIPGGGVIEYEMARAPLGEARFDRGPTNYTCTLSGYSPGFAVDEEPSGAAARVLTKVRSISSGSGGRRVRCAIDWLLRPGQLASFEGVSFTAAYINYYVQGRDAYMDVGERV
jgi:hypothetical protein